MKRTLIGILAGLALGAAAAIAADNFNVLDKLNISFSTATITGQLAPANGGSGVANSKNLTWSNSLTLAGTDATTMTFPATSATIARTDAANTFTGTQTIGALVATTVNGNTVSTGTGTLTLGASKTLTANNSLTLAGTDSTTMTFPTTSATIARTDALQTFTGVQTFTNGINVGASNLTVYNVTSFTVTLTGCAAGTTGTALYSQVGNIIVIDYPTLTCTSNATTKTLTGQPGAVGPSSAKGGLMAIVQDNGAAFAVGLAAVGSGSGNVTLSKDVNGTAFTAAGTFTMKATTLVYTLQ